MPSRPSRMPLPPVHCCHIQSHSDQHASCPTHQRRQLEQFYNSRLTANGIHCRTSHKSCVLPRLATARLIGVLGNQTFGLLMSSDLKWSNHLFVFSCRAYKILGLIRCSFSSGLHVSAKKNLYPTLIRSQLTYDSQIWRPHLIKDILALERIQRRATKYIRNDFHSVYKHPSISYP